MKNEQRSDEIVRQVNKHGYLSVQALSELCDASIVTIRRDLVQLDNQNRIKRTHGGAASTLPLPNAEIITPADAANPVNQLIMNRVDALITSDPLTGIMPSSVGRPKIPIVAESLEIPEAETCIEVDNYVAGRALGRWAGEYAAQKWNGKARILDLSYHRSNTQERSRGFLEGVREVLPAAELRLTINTQSRDEVAYQLTRDALTIYPDINIIFAINDTSASGAYRACQDLNIPTDQLIILPFGVEGPTMLDLIARNEWCAAGLGMFPDVVAVVCVEAAISSYNHQALPPRLTTPFSIITHNNLGQYFMKSDEGWKLRWPEGPCNLKLPLAMKYHHPNKDRRLPRRIGFLYTYVEHEWYKSLVKAMVGYCERLGIQLEIMDFEKTQKDELNLRRQEIARRAVKEVKTGDTILIDTGDIAFALAEQLRDLHHLTVITNSLDVIDALRDSSSITLISTGGALRRGSQAFVGPTAEATLKEFHIDKLFLMVSGVSSEGGLSHTNISEVTIKQQMIRSASEVILLADHACFNEGSLVQVAPITVVNKLITDDALAASARIELGTKGIQVIVATM